MIVVKIGGSCLSNKDDIRRVIEIVEKSMENGAKPVLVVSAFKGVTDELLAQAQNALTTGSNLERIEKLHYEFIENLSPRMREEAERQVLRLIHQLELLLGEVSSSRVLSSIAKDEILSYGEKLATEIVADYLTDSGFKAKPLWDSDAGIITNSNFGNGSILDKSIHFVKEKLRVPYLPVVAGFFGRDEEGRVVTLGRGGSDYTATFIAAALNCEAILFKDVDGLMTADPKIVKAAKTIRKINYLDALELARYGSKIIYEKAIIPAMKAKIKIKIKNFYNPAKETIICDKSEGEETAVSSLTNLAKVDVISYLDITDIATSLLSELSRLDIYPLLLTQASRVGISLITNRSTFEIILRTIQEKDKNAKVKVESNLGLVTIIGGKILEKNIASILKLLFDKRINIHAIEQSASRRNLCILVDENDVQTVIKVIHEHFIL